ncbi:unnamed protein product [Dovyalis caffra]|uniref:Uncharacterized protein n=1 Tax=Dovyalis caffra TaxID=77055 RepID=A0AAV1RJL4_9ROSI|nr:unnamed protein product [Dovyalis caffra]
MALSAKIPIKEARKMAQLGNVNLISRVELGGRRTGWRVEEKGMKPKEPRRFGRLGKRRSSEPVTSEMMRIKLKERVRD